MNKTKNTIFTAAIKVFSTNGYNGATMDDIALKAGVAKGTLYYHFKSKEEIFKYIVREGMNEIKENIQEAVDREQDCILRLKTLCKVQIDLVCENRDFFKVIMSQLWGTELRQLELRKVVQDYILLLEGYLKVGIEKEVLEKGNPSLMAYTYFGALCSTIVYQLINEDKNETVNFDEIIHNLTDYLLKGMVNAK
ncbi:TetR/AcrR family transcriptional regulator [Clostridium ganghwense]|uniref:TetR/AcrR family transcriptional regulator n=1 Tax=Clostridium ganghwense TaxID=312089 RepID=A0ABT4CWA8_9CLOT|nr:TetR/AcrR family transcriptional regulator [Clostridium ganghwense]MCY6372703.1 TetR/AcrR family transcriptional regulator [Clostridium ganghwense]